MKKSLTKLKHPTFNKKLSLLQIHNLYSILKPSLPEQTGVRLKEEIFKIAKSITPYDLMQSMKILYGEKFKPESPAQIAELFVKGIYQSNFFSYVKVIRSLNGR